MKKTGIAAIILAAMLLSSCGQVGEGNSRTTAKKKDASSGAVADAAEEEAQEEAEAENEDGSADDSAVAGAVSIGEDDANSESVESADSAGDTAYNSDVTAAENQSAGDGQGTANSSGDTNAQNGQASDGEKVYYEDVDDPYVGTFYQDYSERCSMTISSEGGSVYTVNISWGDSAYSSYVWTFSGEFNGRAVMNYENCVKAYVTYDEDGNEIRNPVFSHGTGYIQMNDFGLTWADDHESEQYSFSRS